MDKPINSTILISPDPMMYYLRDLHSYICYHLSCMTSKSFLRAMQIAMTFCWFWLLLNRLIGFLTSRIK